MAFKNPARGTRLVPSPKTIVSLLNSDCSEEKEMILKQNLENFVPKYIEMISFGFLFSRANTET